MSALTREAFDCSVCGKDAKDDPHAKWQIGVPESRVGLPVPKQMRDAARLGYTIEVVCSECQS
jgi:hypothetical protein